VVRVANDALGLLEELGQAGSDAEVVIEATYGWYRVVDLRRDAGFSVHLAHPAGNDWCSPPVKIGCAQCSRRRRRSTTRTS
jgi:hypothetical protein